MKKSKVFLNNWFIYFMAFVMTILSLVGAPLMIWAVAYSMKIGNPTASLAILIFVIVLAVILVPITPLVIWKNLIQWTIIDEKSIRSRNIYKVLREITWNEVEEIAIMKLNLSSPGSGLKWIVLFERDEEKKLVNGVMNTDTLISVRYTKKNKEWLKQYWNKTIEEKHFVA